jgi:hypothetical protein
MTAEDVPLRRRAAACLRLFYARHPNGAIRTSLHCLARTVVVRVAVYRESDDLRPTTTAFAVWQRAAPLHGEARGRPRARALDGYLDAAVSRATCRALSLAGVAESTSARCAAAARDGGPGQSVPPDIHAAEDESRTPAGSPGTAARRPSRPPAALRSSGGADPYDPRRPVRRSTAALRASPVAPSLREHIADLDGLIVSALHVGLRPARACAWRARLHALTEASPPTRTAIERAERRLRRWVARRDVA